MTYRDSEHEAFADRLTRGFAAIFHEEYDPKPYAAMELIQNVLEVLNWPAEQMESEGMSVAEKMAVVRIVAVLKESAEIIGLLQDAELDRLVAAQEREERA